MVGAAQGVLEVGENRIHPSKLRVLDNCSPAAHHHRLINAARRGDAMKAGANPSETTRVPVARCCCAQAAISVRRKPSTTVSFMRNG